MDFCVRLLHGLFGKTINNYFSRNSVNFSLKAVSNAAQDQLGCKVVEELLSLLNEKWQKLALLLIQRTSVDKGLRVARGTELARLDELYEKNLIVSHTDSFVVFKESCGRHEKIKKERNNVLLCNCLPSMSIKMIIRPNGKKLVYPDNDKADKAVEYLFEHLQEYRMGTPNFLNKKFSNFLYVREFEKVTCLLHITGWLYDDDKASVSSSQSVEREQVSLDASNFDAFYGREIMNYFPKMHSMTSGYVGNRGCRGQNRNVSFDSDLPCCSKDLV